MDQWEIDARTIPELLAENDMIETYPHDRPYPSRLIIGWDGRGPIHAVVADVLESDETAIITVYRPDTVRWENDFRTRRRS
jgi:hypothetical protein